MSSRNGSTPHLFIDADDTLWENNMYFEAAFQRFVDVLRHSRLSAAEVRLCLDEIEMVNREIHGYGAVQFGRNMQECFTRLCEREHCQADLDAVMACATEIMEHPLQLIDGVGETLEYLNDRYPLTLFTKGDPTEQMRKVEASGLSNFFIDVVVAREKNESSYRDLLHRAGVSAEIAWMVGNSPKSDINPPLAIGMNAVFIPHPRNWHLEEEEIVPGTGKVLELSQFSDLRRHF